VRVWDTPAYRAVRAALQREQLLGGLVCVRCGGRIEPGDRMDVGHVDGDPSRIWGPEHARCNRATARHRVERRAVRSRVW
jgi:hypothetical protein